MLKERFPLEEGTVCDATFMSAKALRAFLDGQIAGTEDGVMFSLHMKATMMKVSDPIIFGHAVRAWLGPVWDTHGDAIRAAGGSPNSGLADVLAAIETMDNAAEIKPRLPRWSAPRCTWSTATRASPTCTYLRT